METAPLVATITNVCSFCWCAACSFCAAVR